MVTLQVLGLVLEVCAFACLLVIQGSAGNSSIFLVFTLIFVVRYENTVSFSDKSVANFNFVKLGC